MDILTEYTDYITLGFYFKAHELLEENLWDKHSKEERNLYYKGLINAAVAMELVRKGRKEQGRKVWNTYLKYKIQSYFEVNFKVENQWNKITGNGLK
jgi:hypothetical protein